MQELSLLCKNTDRKPALLPALPILLINHPTVIRYICVLTRNKHHFNCVPNGDIVEYLFPVTDIDFVRDRPLKDRTESFS